MGHPVFIICASQGKYFNSYLDKFADLDLQVKVNSVSGRQIQEVSPSVVAETSSFPDVILHLGTNNMPHRFETPVAIVERMKKLASQIRKVNPECRIHISSVLPRQTNNYEFGSDRQKEEFAQNYAAHLERLDYINSKATVTNVLMRQELSSIPGCCQFIDNDTVFLGKRSLVKRHLLSRDGLHLTPEGASALLGNMLHRVSNRLNVVPCLPPTPPPSKSCQPTTPSLTCSDAFPEALKTDQSASSVSVAEPAVLPGKMSYQNALLVPKPLGKCTASLPAPKPIILSKQLKPTDSIPQRLPLPTPIPSKPDPYCTFQVIGRGGRMIQDCVDSDCGISFNDDDNLLPVCGNAVSFLDSFKLNNRFSTFSRFLSTDDESETSEPSASSLMSGSSSLSCDAEDSASSFFIRRRRRRNRRHQKRNLNGKRDKRMKRTQKKKRTCHAGNVKNAGELCGKFVRNESRECTSQSVVQIASNRNDFSQLVRTDDRKECGMISSGTAASSGMTQEDACSEKKLKIPGSQSERMLEMTCVLMCQKAGGDHLPVDGPMAPEQSISVVASGSFSQDDSIFSEFTKNKQCVCISTINIVYLNSVSRNAFSQSSIDHVILEGDSYYRQCKRKLGPGHKHPYLMVDELDRIVEFNGLRFRIDHNADFAEQGLFSQKAEGLASKLEKVFREDSQNGYIFIGQSKAVSFWYDSGSFYLFNSHSVDEKNRTKSNGGKGRVFKCGNVMQLASSLMTNSDFTQAHSLMLDAYEIIRIIPTCLTEEVHPVDNVFVPVSQQQAAPIKVMEIVLTEDEESRDSPIQFENIKDNNTLDPYYEEPKLDNKNLSNNNCLSGIKINSNDPKLYLKTFVMLEDICKNKNTKRGRPKKTKVGRPKISDFSTDKPKNSPKQKKLNNDYEMNNFFGDIKINGDDPKLLLDTYVILDDIYRKKNKGGRPPKSKKKIGRPKTSDLTRDEQLSKASGTYNKKHPDINQKTSKTYTDKNPDINRKTTKTYTDKNPGSHLPKELRDNELVGEYSGEKLKLIKKYELKNKNLRSNDCSRCPTCSARLFEEELGKNKKIFPQWCCSNGVALVTLPPLTNELYDDKTFLHFPLAYNSFFAFAVFTANIQDKNVKGLKFLKIKGRVYHKVPAYDNSGFKKSNLFIDDGSSVELDVGDLDKELIQEIHSHLQACNNPFLAEYRRLHDVEAENARLVFAHTSRATHGPVLGDCPTSSEVTGYIDCSENVKYDSRQVTVWKKGDRRPFQIYTTSPFLEPMSYPLLYPEGTLGWSRFSLGGDGKKLSLLKYVRCLLLSDDRFGKFSKLSETWLVDMYVRIEDERLQFFRRNQYAGSRKELRTAPADEIQASIREREQMEQNIREDETIQGEGGVLPGRVYLPESFTGGPRYMRKAYMDSMGIVSQLGGPTYFLTFTAFGQWEEIKLSKHDPDKDQPDVVNRVFYRKFREILRDIKVFFGPQVYVVWCIEFQMRGLPHAHICFRVEGGGPSQGEDIDRFIRADIPQPDEADGELRRLVLRHMVHGPCGPGYPNKLSCWDKNKQRCSKFFPKSHVESTYTDDTGYPQYRRDRNNKGVQKFMGKSYTIDDRWVVPYNPSLLMKYQCHVNLELASARAVVKYLFKYISKGPSLRRVAVEVVPGEDHRENEVNEVEEFVTQRHIGSTDAAWRVLSYDLTGRKPAVMSLPVHLEGKNSVIFKAGDEENALRDSKSRLEIYFNRPNLPEISHLTYTQFYTDYMIHGSRPDSVKSEVWEHPDGKHFITKRKEPCVARMYWVSPRFIEQYYLRMLLSQFPCFGYSNLLELGGPNCKTFQEVAKALGLAEDGSEYIQALDEAFEFMTGSEYRRLFVLLLREGANAVEMWEKFALRLADDIIQMNIKNQTGKSESWCLDQALLDIDHGLRRHQSSLAEVGLPVVKDKETELSREISSYNKDDEARTVEAWKDKLSDDQVKVFKHFEKLLVLLESEEMSDLNKVVFLDGPGGSGKTLVLRVISSLFRANGKVVLCVATTGIAALNLVGGTTAHSMFGFPINISSDSYWFLTNGSQRAELIREASLIIYDEAPMAHRHTIELFDRSLRDLMDRQDCEFGGKIVVFSGDFRQIPPVVNKSNCEEVVASSICNSAIWSCVKTMKLTTSHRVVDNSLYSEFLLKLGSAEIEPEIFSVAENRFEMLVALPHLQYVDTVEELIDFVFPQDILENPEVCAERAILSTLNFNVDEINTKICGNLEGEFVSLYSRDRILQNRESFHIDSSFLHLVVAKGVPNHILRLKVGAVCMIVRNLNFDLGLVNGTKVIIERFLKNSIVCSKPNCNKRYVIPRISFTFEMDVHEGLKMIRMQYPLKLAYAMTVHKSQGQTLERVGLDLRTHCFTHGQLYVALSRTRSPDNIRLLVPEKYVVDGTAHAKNIVYKELLNKKK